MTTSNSKMICFPKGGTHLVQGYKGGNSNPSCLQEVHTGLGSVNGVHNNVVQGSTRRGNGHVVLVIDGTQVSLRSEG